MSDLACISCHAPLTVVLDADGKVDHHVDSGGKSSGPAADLPPEPYGLLEELRNGGPDAAGAYSNLKVRLQLGMSFHVHMGVRR